MNGQLDGCLCNCHDAGYRDMTGEAEHDTCVDCQRALCAESERYGEHFIRQLFLRSVERFCTCGGQGLLESPGRCPACAVWNDMKPEPLVKPLGRTR